MEDIEILHLLMVEEGVVVGHLVGVLMDLHLDLGLSGIEMKEGCIEIIQMLDQGKEIGSAQILCEYIFFFLHASFCICSCF